MKELFAKIGDRGEIVVKQNLPCCHSKMDEKLQESTMDPEDTFPKIDVNRSRFPYCIVWTPIPVLT